MNLLQNRNYKRVAPLAVLLGGLLAASVTMAGGGGHHGGYGDDDDDYDRDEPRFEDRGDSLRAWLEVDDLYRNRNVRVEIEAHADVDIECVRYQGYGGNNRRIRREIEVEVEGDETFSRHSIRGDELDVWVETDDIADELEDRYEDHDDDDDYYGRGDLCPNNYRLSRVSSVQFSDAKIEVKQGNREVETWLCSFDDDTSNGTVPRDEVDCHRLND